MTAPERVVLERLEVALEAGTAEAPEIALMLIGGSGVELDAEELRGATRRAVQLLAAGGDPMRGLEPEGRAVEALASDLDTADRRLDLATGLAGLRDLAHDLPRVSRLIACLLADLDCSWRWFACTLLAEELAPEDA